MKGFSRDYAHVTGIREGVEKWESHDPECEREEEKAAVWAKFLNMCGQTFPIKESYAPPKRSALVSLPHSVIIVELSWEASLFANTIIDFNMQQHLGPSATDISCGRVYEKPFMWVPQWSVYSICGHNCATASKGEILSTKRNGRKS